MLLVVAALAEETKVVTGRGRQVRRIGTAAGLVEVRRDGQRFCLLKSGVGPKAASRRLECALRHIRPSLILVVGYAGALDGGLRLGDLVAIESSSLLRKLRPESIAAGAPICEGSWELSASHRMACMCTSAGLAVCCSRGLTSHEVVGDPMHKEALYRQFGAAVIDMETATLARVAEAAGIPAACVRAITDTAGDDFLKDLSFRSRAGRLRTHVNSLATGHFFRRMHGWTERAEAARRSLGQFLDVYFEGVRAAEPDHKTC
jgi:purine-nucleoside phosphorylase